MTRRRRWRGLRNSVNVTGLTVIGVGVLALLGWLWQDSIMYYLWSGIFWGPGLVLLAAVRRMGRGSAWLTVPALFSVSLGVVWLIAAFFGMYTMLYTWPLILPGSLGLGLSVYGDLTRKRTPAEVGEWLGKLGLGLTGLGLVVVELLRNFDTLTTGFVGIGIALAIIVAGFLLFGRKKSPTTRRYNAEYSTRRPALSEDILLGDPLFDEELTRERTRRK